MNTPLQLSPWFSSTGESTLPPGNYNGQLFWVTPVDPHMRPLPADDALLGIGPYGRSFDCGRYENFTIRPNDDGEYTRPINGILVRGCADLVDINVLDIRGNRTQEQEVFGVHIINLNEYDPIAGGSVVRNVTVSSSYENAYITGICASTLNHNKKLTPKRTRIEDCFVSTHPKGNQCGYTATLDTLIMDCGCAGPNNYFNCDTGLMSGVDIINPTGTPSRAYLRLVSTQIGKLNEQYEKRNLLSVGGHIWFEGSGPHFLCEFLDKEGIGIKNITIRDLVIHTEPGSEFYALSTDAPEIDGLTFDNVILPPNAKINTPNMTATGAREKLRVNGRLMHEVFARTQS